MASQAGAFFGQRQTSQQRSKELAPEIARRVGGMIQAVMKEGALQSGDPTVVA